MKKYIFKKNKKFRRITRKFFEKKKEPADSLESSDCQVEIFVL